jgi:cytoskeletal protein CcmA (bactofilin family)
LKLFCDKNHELKHFTETYNNYELLILKGAVLEAGGSLTFQSAKIEGELRCEKLMIEGSVWIGPRARVVVERVVFRQMTVEIGGQLTGFGEVKAKSVEARKEPPIEEKISETLK